MSEGWGLWYLMMINVFRHDLQANRIACAKEYNNASLTELPGYPGAAAAAHISLEKKDTHCVSEGITSSFPSLGVDTYRPNINQILTLYQSQRRVLHHSAWLSVEVLQLVVDMGRQDLRAIDKR